MKSITKALSNPGGGKIAKAATGIDGTGRHGGVLQKAAVGKAMGHSKMPTQPVSTDRGAFKIR